MHETSKNQLTALVGEIVTTWSTVEVHIDWTISDALNLSVVKSAIILGQITMRRKIDILRTLIAVSHMEQENKEHYYDLTNRLKALNAIRNKIAHSIIAKLDDADTYTIARVATSTKRGGDLIEEEWSEEMFLSEINQMLNVGAELDELGPLLKQTLEESALVGAIMEPSPDLSTD